MHAVYQTCVIVNVAKNLKQTTVHGSFGNITIIGIATWHTRDERQQTNAATATHHEIEQLAENPRSPRPPEEHGQQLEHLDHWARPRKYRVV